MGLESSFTVSIQESRFKFRLNIFFFLLKSSMSDLNHPAIKRFLESPSRSSSPLNQGSEAHSVGHSETESLSQPTEPGERDTPGWKEEEFRPLEHRPGRNTGKVRWLRYTQEMHTLGTIAACRIYRYIQCCEKVFTCFLLFLCIS